MGIKYLHKMHIFSQSTSHDDVIIIGDRDALRSLRDTIDRAIAKEKPLAACGVFCNDGEGYNVIVSEGNVDSLRLPYSDKELHPVSDGDYPRFSKDEMKYIYNEAWIENVWKNVPDFGPSPSVKVEVDL